MLLRTHRKKLENFMPTRMRTWNVITISVAMRDPGVNGVTI
jgi:hypothetical protein